MYDKKWVKPLALALSLPGTIFGAALILMKLAQAEVISKLVAIIIFLLIVGNTLFLLVYYGYKNKD